MGHTRDNWLTSLFRVWRKNSIWCFTTSGDALLLRPAALLSDSLHADLQPWADPRHAYRRGRPQPHGYSRELARMVDATDGLKVYQYAPDMEAARRMMNRKEVYGILEIPMRLRQTARPRRTGQRHILRRRQPASALPSGIVQPHRPADGHSHPPPAGKIASGGLQLQDIGGSPIDTQSVMMGDPPRASPRSSCPECSCSYFIRA